MAVRRLWASVGDAVEAQEHCPPCGRSQGGAGLYGVSSQQILQLLGSQACCMPMGCRSQNRSQNQVHDCIYSTYTISTE